MRGQQLAQLERILLLQLQVHPVEVGAHTRHTKATQPAGHQVAWQKWQQQQKQEQGELQLYALTRNRIACVWPGQEHHKGCLSIWV